MDNVIVRGTTPTFIIDFNVVDVTEIDSIYFVIKQCGIPIIELDKNRAEVNQLDNSISFTLTQRETLGLDSYKLAIVSCDWVMDNTRGFTPEIAYKIVNPAKEGVI